VTTPDGWSAALTELADTVTVLPPRAVGAVPEPAVSMTALPAATGAVVEAVTVNAGAAARSAGPFELGTVKEGPLPVGVPAAKPVAGQEAEGAE